MPSAGPGAARLHRRPPVCRGSSVRMALGLAAGPTKGSTTQPGLTMSSVDARPTMATGCALRLTAWVQGRGGRASHSPTCPAPHCTRRFFRCCDGGRRNLFPPPRPVGLAAMVGWQVSFLLCLFDLAAGWLVLAVSDVGTRSNINHRGQRGCGRRQRRRWSIRKGQ
ncbi:hypothetical protein DFH27DRAFT_228720 [Peziza echinospora]|nr:hypothetical protein DFH27DRAFT_228720 [Peziza echinospora]